MILRYARRAHTSLFTVAGRVEWSELVGFSCSVVGFSEGGVNKLLGRLLLSLSFWHQYSMLDPD